VLAELNAAGFPVGHDGGDLVPEALGVVFVGDVAELVHDDVVEQLGGGADQAPVDADIVVEAAAAPLAARIAGHQFTVFDADNIRPIISAFAKNISCFTLLPEMDLQPCGFDARCRAEIGFVQIDIQKRVVNFAALLFVRIMDDAQGIGTTPMQNHIAFRKIAGSGDAPATAPDQFAKEKAQELSFE